MGLSDKIQDILAARTKIKSKIYENKIHDEMTKDEIAKIAPVFHEPVVEQLQHSFLPPYPQTELHTAELPRLEAPRTKKRKIVDLDPDRGISEALLETFHLKAPSEFLNLFEEPQRTQEIETTIQKINVLLQSYGGKKSKGSVNFDSIIKNLRHYKESIKSLQKIPHFQVQGMSGRSESTGSGMKIRGCEENRDGGLCQRLELLIASRLAGNDNRNIVNEAKSILNLLLKDKLITKSDYAMILVNYLIYHSIYSR